MTKIINPWAQDKPFPRFYNLEKPPMYIRGDYRLYKQFTKSYLITYKNLAISNLARANKGLVDKLHEGAMPEENDWILKGAIESREKYKHLITANEMGLLPK